MSQNLIAGLYDGGSGCLRPGIGKSVPSRARYNRKSLARNASRRFVEYCDEAILVMAKPPAVFFGKRLNFLLTALPFFGQMRFNSESYSAEPSLRFSHCLTAGTFQP